MPENPVPFVSVIIPAFKSGMNLPSCLGSLLNSTVPAGEILILSFEEIDLDSKLSGSFNNIVVQKIKSNNSWNKAVSSGISLVQGDVILVVEPDILLPGNAIEEFTEILSNKKGIVAPVSGDMDGPQYKQKYDPVSKKYSVDKRIKTFTGKSRQGYITLPHVYRCCFAVSKSILTETLFADDIPDPDVFMLDLCLKIRMSGFAVMAAKDVSVESVRYKNLWKSFLTEDNKKVIDSLKIFQNKLYNYYQVKEIPSMKELFLLEEADFLLNPEHILYSVLVVKTREENFRPICLQRLQRYLDPGNCEIILAGTGNNDESYLGTGWKEVRNFPVENLKDIPEIINTAAKESRGCYLLIIRDTCGITDGFMPDLTSVLNSAPGIIAAGPRTNYLHGFQIDPEAQYDSIAGADEYSSIIKNRPGNPVSQVNTLDGFCCLFNRNLLNQSGPLDARFGYYGYIYDDLWKRAAKYGYSLSLAENVFIHNEKVFKEESETGRKQDEPLFRQKWKMDAGTIRRKANLEYLKTKSAAAKRHEKESGYVSDGLLVEIKSLLEKANDFVKKNKLQNGIEIYEQILSLHSGQIETIHNLAMTYYQAGDKKKAHNLLNKIIVTAPDFAPAHNSLGLISLNEGEIKKAYCCFRDAVYYDIEFENAYTNLKIAADHLGITVDKPADIVFYTGGIKFDGNTIYDKGLGGSESALFYMAREFAGMGLSVKVFNNCDTPGTYEGVEYGDFVDFYIHNRFAGAKVFISSRSFKPFYLNLKTEVKIIWLHDTFNVFFVGGYDFSKLNFDDLKIFVLSKFHKEEWKQNLPVEDNNFYVTRNGFNPELFKGSEKARKKYKFIYSSRPSRGLKELLDIFPEIKKRLPEAELHIFGYLISEKDEEMLPYLEKARQPGVVLRGSVSQKQLAEEMSEAYVLTYPSIFRETSCITAIEAQAAGLPVVTTSLAALKETVEDGVSGVLLEGDARTQEYKKKFVNAVVEICENKKIFEKLSNGGRERADSIYSWNKVAEDWLNEINQLLGKKNLDLIRHGDVMERRQEIMEDKSAKPVLSLCMIVKNEEKLLPVCLNSVKDLVNEIVIVDTGSTDRTLEIAGSYDARVFSFNWVDDFSAARNESIKHAEGEWILYLDADERISPENARKIREVIKNPEIDAVNLVESIAQTNGNLIKKFKSDYTRLFRRTGTLGFTGRVHEQILPSIIKNGGKVIKTDIEIEHFGFSDSGEKKTARMNRNLSLLLLEKEKSPEDPFVYYNLGGTYKEMVKNPEAIDAYHKCLEYNKNDPLKSQLISQVYLSLSQIYFKDDQKNKAALSASESLKINPENILAEYLLAGLAFEENDFITAKKYLSDILEKTEQNPGYAEEIDIGQVLLDLGNCHYRLNEYTPAIEFYRKTVRIIPDSLEGYYNLGNACFMTKNYSLAEEAYKKSLEIKPDLKPASENLLKVQSLISGENK